MAFIALPNNFIHFKEYTEQDVHMVGIGGRGDSRRCRVGERQTLSISHVLCGQRGQKRGIFREGFVEEAAFDLSLKS